MRNWQLKVLGLFIAGTTWTVVAYAGNPPTAESFKGIALEHGQPPSGLVLIREPAPVTVTVRGLQSSLANFHKESLHAVIDLAGAHKGSNLLPVRVRVDSPDQSVMFAAVDPDNAEVVLDQRSEEHTSELQSPDHLVCRLLLEKKNNKPSNPCICQLV